MVPKLRQGRCGRRRGNIENAIRKMQTRNRLLSLLHREGASVVEEADVLSVYLLGEVELDAVLRLQRRLHFEVTGDKNQAFLVVCEHPPLVTMGRQGSRSHLKVDPAELGWPVRWVGRGGGCWLHRPGQIAVYAVFPLDRLGLSIGDYLHDLGSVFAATFGDFSVRQRATV